MIIQHLGHSCFRLSTADGISIVTDPYDPSVGYDLPEKSADIVTVSHEHHDHNNTAALPGAEIVKGAGVHTIQGVRITGFETCHDDIHGARRGKNTVFVIEADDVRVAHLGDLGHDLSDDMINEMGELDALLIPVGGVFTIDAFQAAALAKRIGARVTVPMHYQTERLSFQLGSLDHFINELGLRWVQRDTLTVGETSASVVVLRDGMGL